MRVEQIIKYCFLILVAGMIGGCDREEVSEELQGIESFQILPDENVKWSLGAIAGDGVVLLTYIDNLNEYVFKLIENDGTEIWTKKFGYMYNPNEFGQIPKMKIILDSDNSFAIFFGNGLKKINDQGNLVFSHDSFLGSSSNLVTVRDVQIGMNNTYIISGSFYRYSAGGTSAFIEEKEQDGTIVGQGISGGHIGNITRPNPSTRKYAYTGAIALEDGKWIAAGIHDYIVAGVAKENELFHVIVFDSKITTGAPKLLSVIDKDVTMEGRELIKVSEDSYAYLMSPEGGASLEQRSRLYHFDTSGTVKGITYLDFAPQNYAAGGSPYTSRGLVKNASGGYTGLMRVGEEISTASVFDQPATYKGAHYGYVYELNANMELIHSEYINRNSSNYFNGITKMSNDKILLFGTTLSFGEEMKLTIAIR
jgi:hypothetical protein